MSYWSSGLGSVVSIATAYGLDDLGIESQWRQDFLHLSRPVLRPPAPCTVGTRSFPGVRCGWDVTLTPHPLLVKVISQQAEVAQGVPGRLRPRNFLDVRHYKGGRSSAICTSRLYPRRNPRYSFSGAKLTPGHMVVSGEATEKIPSDTTRNRYPGTYQLVEQCLNHYATPAPPSNAEVKTRIKLYLYST